MGKNKKKGLKDLGTKRQGDKEKRRKMEDWKEIITGMMEAWNKVEIGKIILSNKKFGLFLLE